MGYQLTYTIPHKIQHVLRIISRTAHIIPAKGFDVKKKVKYNVLCNVFL